MQCQGQLGCVGLAGCECAFIGCGLCGLVVPRCLCFGGADGLRPGVSVVGVVLGRWRFLQARVLVCWGAVGLWELLLLGWDALAGVVVLYLWGWACFGVVRSCGSGCSGWRPTVHAYAANPLM